jgi:hypothetical protein
VTKSVTNIGDVWTRFLESLAAGAPLVEAMGQHKLTTRQIEELTLNPAEAARFFEAQQLARRRNWTVWDIDEISRRVAMGMTCKAAVIAVKGEDLRADLYELMAADEAIAERFSTAERTAARVMEEEMLEIADDKEGDVLQTPKGPIPSSANVARARLQWDVRRASQVVRDRPRYGEHTRPAVELTFNIDHAGRLEEARARARDRRATPRQVEEAIDASFTPVEAPAAPPTPRAAPEIELQPTAPNFSTDWMDADGPTDVVKPTAVEKSEPAVGNGPGESTIWREEK